MNDRADPAPETRKRRRNRRSNGGSPLRARLSLGAAILLGVVVIGSPLGTPAHE